MRKTNAGISDDGGNKEPPKKNIIPYILFPKEKRDTQKTWLGIPETQ